MRPSRKTSFQWHDCIHLAGLQLRGQRRIDRSSLFMPVTGQPEVTVRAASKSAAALQSPIRGPGLDRRAVFQVKSGLAAAGSVAGSAGAFLSAAAERPPRTARATRRVASGQTIVLNSDKKLQIVMYCLITVCLGKGIIKHFWHFCLKTIFNLWCITQQLCQQCYQISQDN